MTKNTFFAGLHKIMMSFQEFKPDPKTQDFYFEMLKDTSEEDFKRAVFELCRNKKEWFPSDNFIALIRDASNSNDLPAIEAWHRIVSEKIKCRGNEKRTICDPVIQTCIEMMGGWHGICSEPSAYSYDFKTFEKFFNCITRNNINENKLIEDKREVKKMIEEDQQRQIEKRAEVKQVNLGDNKILRFHNGKPVISEKKHGVTKRLF